jgi:predicted transcriptional regulator
MLCHNILLNRSKTVTVRLNPKLHYLAELAARRQRRTLSSFIEWAIEESLQFVTIEERWHLATLTADKRITVADIARDVWEVDEIDRFFKLALRYPHLLTHEEQVLWKLVRENAYLWYGFEHMAASATVALSDLSAVADLLRPHWEAFKQVAAGEADESILPQEPADDLLDDDEFMR